ncbi:MAG TPA: amidase family protein [Myxococcota bacterium]|jgi:aspartyl-tRNA(Asn)/glutamyl-tRNA(Gln) amidotransferase subunit A|nr:amidase family protein [Myxococcota bacterium]
MSDLLRRPLTEIVDRLARRDLSPLELMDATLDRIAATHERLNAFVQMRDRDALRAEARAAGERIARGEGRPLEGVPLGVKDLEDAAGLVTTHGSIPFKDHRVDHDSIQVARLRAAGAIVIGKTNAPEFGWTAITKNLIYGETRNPWNLERTPGGSSGGSSAAIAGGLVPLVTASDGGGSVRLPATFTGCFGLKPSLGRIPHGPDSQWVTVDTATHGPLTRTVEDGALHLDIVAGAHPLDPQSLPHPGYSYRAVLRHLPAGLRIGFSPDLGYAVVQRDVADVVAEAAQVFEALGHHVEFVKGGPPEAGREWGLVNCFDLASRLHPLLPDHEPEFGRQFLWGVKHGWKMTPEVWGAAQKRREALNRWCAEAFDRYDLLLTPTTPYDPPPARGPFPTEIDGRKLPETSVASFTIPFNLSWHPAATVRAGMSRAGLPVGLQIVAARHRDDLVLQAAHAFEQARPWADHWPTP